MGYKRERERKESNGVFFHAILHSWENCCITRFICVSKMLNYNNHASKENRERKILKILELFDFNIEIKQG
jgi:hypothetical protein